MYVMYIYIYYTFYNPHIPLYASYASSYGNRFKWTFCKSKKWEKDDKPSNVYPLCSIEMAFFGTMWWVCTVLGCGSPCVAGYQWPQGCIMVHLPGSFPASWVRTRIWLALVDLIGFLMMQIGSKMNGSPATRSRTVPHQQAARNLRWGNQNLQVDGWHIRVPASEFGAPQRSTWQHRQQHAYPQCGGSDEEGEDQGGSDHRKLWQLWWASAFLSMGDLQDPKMGIFPFQSNLGSWRSPIDSKEISVLLRRDGLHGTWRQGDPRSSAGDFWDLRSWGGVQAKQEEEDARPLGSGWKLGGS